MNYKELIGKTVFDFTKDAAIIERITKVNPSDKEKVAKYKKDCHPIGKAEGIEELAEILNNPCIRKGTKQGTPSGRDGVHELHHIPYIFSLKRRA